jgi:hypothetical protein
MNLDLQSNTWHNLTYAYQGEGGSRVTYLDGRKVAEDQAEDTFGDYPPFAMTGYSQGGYVVSTSSEYIDTGALRYAYGAYDPSVDFTGAAGHVWMTEFDTFNPNAVGGDTFIDSDGGTHTGHWNKLELPYKLKPSYLYYKNTGTYTTARCASDWVILGSNDDTTWDLVHTSTNVLDTTLNIPINSTKAYKYLMFLCKTINSSTALYVQQLAYYGHRENDLVRLPDPTNVLKYPHIAMTGPAQRGYVASASSNFDTYNPWEAFDNNTGGGWISVGGTNYSGGDGAYNKSPGSLLGTNSVTGTEIRDGEFLQIETPHKIAVNHILISSGSGDGPTDFKFWGSNDSSAWSLLHTETNHTNGTSAQVDINSSVAYKYHAIVISKTRRTTQGDYVNVRELELYGTEENSSIPIQIGGGNIDKVANFRVYDKFVGEDQALEIWDAQKDDLPRAKNSVTLHKGRLGIGTTEPEGRLAVADEPHNLEEFPPRAMTGYKNYFEGHGEFCVSASSELVDTYRAWDAFNHTGTSDNYDAWISANSIYTLNTNVDVDPSVAANINGVYGEWLELKLPYKITLDRLTIKSRGALGNSYGYTSGPGDGNVWGSNDGVNWTLLTSFSGFTYKSLKTSGAIETLHVNSTTPYSYFRLQPTKRVSTNPDYTPDSYVAIGELRYFGTREQGQSVLHDGQLTLTKSLNVPRIGPALDADDTPRRDRLVVEYNTSTNPTFEGAVRDTSGRGNDGVFYGGASYDATEKALVFDGTDDYITTRIHNQPGDWIHSISFWVKFTSLTGSTEAPFQIGPGTGAAASKYSALDWSSAGLNWYFFSNDLDTTYAVGTGGSKWIHFACVYEGGGATSSRHIYIDGINISSYHSSSPSNPLDFNSNQVLTLGRDSDRASTDPSYFHGKISNFKLYDTALTVEEVKTLYDMGRTGSVVNPQPLHIAAPMQVEKTLRIPVDNTDTGVYTAGMIRFNKELGKIQVHNGSVWLTVGGVSATGGVVSYADGYTIHTFTGISGTFNVLSGGDMEYLVVAGGGGGGYDGGGGGGAGGMLTGTLTAVTPDSYTITRGGGGAAATEVGSKGGNGSNSTAFNLTALGGGGGGSKSASGNSGGSGGGGGHPSTAGGQGQPGQGSNGGSSSTTGGGGGGGAGGVGGNSVINTSSGNGGVGLQSGISGTNTYYAGGGGGGSYSHGGGSGGNGGGGGGGDNIENASQSGTPNTGGGGGADGIASGPGASAGGSGIVIIRYLS